MTTQPSARRHITPDVKRFFLLSLVTLGTYQAYWGWKNWEIVRRARGAKHHTSIRGVFVIFSCFGLFEEVLALAKGAGYRKDYSGAGLAAGFLALNLISNRAANSNSVGLGLSIAVSLASLALIAWLVSPVLRAMRYYVEHSDQSDETFRVKPNWGLIVFLVLLELTIFVLSFALAMQQL
jgi:hypothetical protein